MSFTNKIASDISALSAVLSDILQTQDKYTIWGQRSAYSFSRPHLSRSSSTFLRVSVRLIPIFLRLSPIPSPSVQRGLKDIDRKSWLFLVLSGFATGGSWLCYYRALQTGPASVIVPIDKLSILVTVAFSYIVFHEKLSLKSGTGLLLIVVGTLALLI